MVEWLAFGVSVIGLIVMVIGVSSKLSSRIRALEIQHDNNERQITEIKDNARLHEAMNERTFTRFEVGLSEIKESLNKIEGYLEAKK